MFIMFASLCGYLWIFNYFFRCVEWPFFNDQVIALLLELHNMSCRQRLQHRRGLSVLNRSFSLKSSYSRLSSLLVNPNLPMVCTGFDQNRSKHWEARNNQNALGTVSGWSRYYILVFTVLRVYQFTACIWILRICRFSVPSQISCHLCFRSEAAHKLPLSGSTTMGNKSSLLLRDEEIQQIHEETGCEYCVTFELVPWFALLYKVTPVFIDDQQLSGQCGDKKDWINMRQ